MGYTKIEVEEKKVSNPYYGYISMNNYGYENTGKYQWESNFNYENLFSISDILSLHVNSTNRVNQSNNKTLDNSLSYSFPFMRLLFNISYSQSKYKLLNEDEFSNKYYSNGLSTNGLFSLKYSLYHDKNITAKILAGLNYKKSENFLNDVLLEIQSYKLLIANLGMSVSYKNQNYNIFSSLEIYKGLDYLGATNNFAEQSIKFEKYILNLALTKYFNDQYNSKYDFSFRGQYSKDYLYATEEISFGGPYSVRGFKDSSLSGNKGFYIRNELSFLKQVSNYDFSPYVAIDYGHISSAFENNAGTIIGSAIGLRTSIFQIISTDIFYTKALKDTPFTKEYSKNFLGFNLVYSF